MNDERKSVRWYEGAYIVVLLGVLALSMTYLRPHRVGVIDMDKAFKKLGVQERVDAVLKDKDREAQARFEVLKRQLAPEEKRLVAAYEAAKTDDQKSKAAADLQAFQQRFQKGRMDIANEVARFQRDAVVTFRERLRPHVQKVASRKRVDLVLEPEQIFQIMNNAADVTDAVIDEATPEFTPDRVLVDEELLRAKGLWIEAEQGQSGAAPAVAPAR